jgi:hypothetical protein
MLLRPEEVHGASGIGNILEPLPEGHSYIPDHTSRFSLQNNSVPDLHADGLSAVETRRIDLNRLSRKKPADRQRFKSSLAEPLLLAIDGDAILGGEIVEGSKRSDEIRIWKKPSRDPGSEKVMEGLSSLLHSDAQFRRDLRIMGRLAGLYHSPHDEMECSFEFARFTHGFTSGPCDSEKVGRNLHLQNGAVNH